MVQSHLDTTDSNTFILEPHQYTVYILQMEVASPRDTTSMHMTYPSSNRISSYPIRNDHDVLRYYGDKFVNVI